MIEHHIAAARIAFPALLAGVFGSFASVFSEVPAEARAVVLSVLVAVALYLKSYLGARAARNAVDEKRARLELEQLEQSGRHAVVPVAIDAPAERPGE